MYISNKIWFKFESVLLFRVRLTVKFTIDNNIIMHFPPQIILYSFIFLLRRNLIFFLSSNFLYLI